MATTLTDFPASAKNGPRGYGKYLDGQVWRLVKGVDFDSKMQSVRSYLWELAKRKGLRLKTVTEAGARGTVLIVQAVAKG